MVAGFGKLWGSWWRLCFGLSTRQYHSDLRFIFSNLNFSILTLSLSIHTYILYRINSFALFCIILIAVFQLALAVTDSKRIGKQTLLFFKICHSSVTKRIRLPVRTGAFSIRGSVLCGWYWHWAPGPQLGSVGWTTWHQHCLNFICN